MSNVEGTPPAGRVELRKSVRYPLRVLLAVRPHDGSPPFVSRAGDLSEGGISFHAVKALALGSTLELDLSLRDARFTLKGTVVSCMELREEDGFRVGLSFVDPAVAFKLKLGEQAMRIIELQQELSEERGRPVLRAEAAQVWVERYAEGFADAFDPTRERTRA